MPLMKHAPPQCCVAGAVYQELDLISWGHAVVVEALVERASAQYAHCDCLRTCRFFDIKIIDIRKVSLVDL